MKKLIKTGNNTTAASNTLTASTKAETVNATTAWISTSPDPERGNCAAISRNTLDLLKLLPAADRKEVLSRWWEWMVEIKPAVRPALSEQASLLLDRLINEQRESVRRFREACERHVLRRRNRLARIGRAK